MKVLFAILFSVIFKLGIAQSNYFRPKYLVLFDTTIGKLLLDQCSRSIPENISGFFKVNYKDLDTLCANFKEIQEDKNFNNWIKDLELYGYQVIGIIIKDKRYIYINAWEVNEEKLKKIHREWRKWPVLACGGGESYWGAVFDIANRTFYDWQINGHM